MWGKKKKIKIQFYWLNQLAQNTTTTHYRKQDHWVDEVGEQINHNNQQC